jgi:hypothetical protein
MTIPQGTRITLLAQVEHREIVLAGAMRSAASRDCCKCSGQQWVLAVSKR